MPVTQGYSRAGMLLVLDIGNSNSSFGVYEGDQLRSEVRLSTNRSWTRDEFALTLERALALQGTALDALDDAVFASVVPPVNASIIAALRRYLDIDPLVVDHTLDTGMAIRYEPPQDVGADRIVAAIAAHQRYAAPLAGEIAIVIVDFGTATTFDVVSPVPEYLGGVIAPGVGISADALFQKAARLPRVDIVKPSSVIGRTTVGAMQSGLFYGYVGLVEGMLARIRGELDWEVRVVATGGLARKVAPETEQIDVVDDNLMLDGLRILYARNRG